MKRALILPFALVLILALSACTSGVPQEDYDELQQSYQSLIEERNSISENYSGLRNNYNELQQNYESLSSEKEQIIQERDRISGEYSAFREQMSVFVDLSEEEARNRLEEEQKRETIVGLDAEIAEKQGQLYRLQNLIVRTGEEPIRLPAGHFYGGRDVPPGRYQVSNGSSNFVVHNSAGRLQVNIILGSRVPTYVFTLRYGDRIQNARASTLTPIE